MINTMFPAENYVFDTHTDIQNEFIDRILKQGPDKAIEWLDTVKNNTERSKPATLVFKWEGESDEYLFELSKNEDFSDSLNIMLSEPCYTADNLEIGTKYFWRINGGKTNCFYTKDNCFRFINIDGVLNVRDVGGINIKQGLVYRGSDIYSTYKITESGKKTFTDVLKIKTEIELRKEGSDEKIQDGNFEFKKLPYRPYKESFEEEHRKGICDIMEFLSDEKNYPVYIHCLGGADRTGMVALFLRALAGESDEMINIDYELTSLSTYAYGKAEGAAANGYRNRNSDYFKEFLELLDKYAPSKSYAEKVYAFLLDCGVTDECVSKIRKIICK